MKPYDPQMAARVWKRVQAQPEEKLLPQKDPQQLLGMIAQERTAATGYLALSRRCQGRPSLLLRQLFQEEQAHAACLKGIYTLLTGQHPALHQVQPVQEPVTTALRRCYGAQMRSLAQYEQWSSDPEYGQVFARIAAQEREHCRIILELLGTLPPKA